MKTSNNICNALFSRLSGSTNESGLTVDNGFLTWRGFLQQVALRQQQLSALGLKKGDPVLVMNERGNLYWRDMLACWSLGVIVIPICAALPMPRLLVILSLCEPRLILGNVKCPLPEKYRMRVIVDAMIKTTQSSSLSITAVNKHDCAAILFTSGSTGQPKGVPLSHQALLENATQVLARIDFQPDDTFFVAIPFYYTSAICHFISTCLTGASLFATESIKLPGDFIRTILAHQPTCIGGAPIHMRWIADYAKNNSYYCRWLFSAGDYLPPDVTQMLREHMPETILYVAYGLTEIAGRCCLSDVEQLALHPTSVGKPLSGITLTICDDDKEALPAYQVGNVFVRSDLLFKHYLKQKPPEITIYGFNTGDIGYVDASGNLFLLGRADNVFKCSGQKISALYISDELQKLGLFQEVVVVGIEDEVMNRVPCAFFIMKPFVPFVKQEVVSALRKVLPTNHLPRQFIELVSIPRLTSGKPDYQALKALMNQPKEAIGVLSG